MVKQVLGSVGTQAYYGAVKQSKLRVYSPILSWYVREGSASSPDGLPINETWPETGAVRDTTTITDLLACLDCDPEAGVYYTTFGVEREFWVMAGFYEYPKHTEGDAQEPVTDFVAHFEHLEEEDERDYDGAGGLAVHDPRPAYLCQNASTVVFFSTLHRPTQDTTYRLPRLEVLVQRPSTPLESGRGRGASPGYPGPYGVGRGHARREASCWTPTTTSGLARGTWYRLWCGRTHESSKAIGADYAGRVEAGIYQRLASLLRHVNDPRQLRLIPLWLPSNSTVAG